MILPAVQDPGRIQGGKVKIFENFFNSKTVGQKIFDFNSAYNIILKQKVFHGPKIVFPSVI